MTFTFSDGARRLTSRIAIAALIACVAPVAMGASGTWVGGTDNSWLNDANWTPGPAPTAGDTATFNAAPVIPGNTTIDLGAGVTVSSVVFDTTAVPTYTIGNGGAGAQTLTLTDTGPGAAGNPSITMGLAAASAPTVSETFNSNLVLGTAIVSTTTITNNATAASGLALTFNGTVQGGTGGTAGAKTLNTAGTGAINFTNALTAGGASALNLVDTAAGTLTLGGNVTSTLATLRATGGGSIIINGQTVTVSANSFFGGSTAFGKVILQSGGVSFNGGIQSATSSGALAGGDGMGFIVNGGTFSASTVLLGRAQNTGSTTTFFSTAQSLGTSGFQVNGGTATVTGALRIAGSNSSAVGQVSGTGILSVGGELTIGENVTRSSLFQVTGGTVTDTDTVGNGIVIGKGTATVAAAGQLLLTGGTTTTEKVAFGLSGGLAGSSGNFTLNGAAANLYVGSGGIVQAATNSYTATVNLTNGTLGAKADWSSSMNMNLNGAAATPVTIKAADVSNVSHNITLGGVLGGAGGFNKTGGGSLTLTGANTFSGGSTLTTGTLNINGTFALGGGNFGGLNMAGGTLQYAAGTTAGSNGGTDISFGAAFATPKFVTISGNTAIDANSNAVTFANAIGNGGTGGLTLNDSAGGGSFTFNGTGNNYSGATTVNNTILSINGTLTNSAVTVNSAGRLNGVGTISQLVTDSGVIGAATAGTIGTLNLGAGLTLTSGATYNADYNDTTSDLLAITGNLSLTGDTLNLNQLAAPTASSYTLASFTGALSGTFATVNNLPTGYVLDYNANSITLDKTVAPIPEPASLGLLALGAVGLLARRRK